MAPILILPAFLVVFLYVYSPAIALPPSMIDEATHIINGEKLWTNLKTHGVTEALKQDASAKLRTYNPLFLFQSAVTYKLTDGNRLVMHALLLLELLCTLLLISFLPFVLGIRSSPAWLAGGTAVFLFMLAEVPGWYNMQSLRANWVRLHTHDAHSALLLAVHVVCLALSVRTETRKLWWLWSVVAAGALIIAALLKPVAGGLLPAMFVLGAVAFWAGMRTGVVWMLCSVSAFMIVAVHAGVLHHIYEGGSAEAYASGYVLSAESIKVGLIFQLRSYLDAFGPLFLLVIAAPVFMLLWSYRTQGSLREAFRASWPGLYVLLCLVACISVYVPWKHQLPRYMLMGSLCVSTIGGLAIGSFGQIPRPAGKLLLALLLAGTASILLLKVTLFLILLLGIAWYAILRRSPGLFTWFWLGAWIAPFLYFVVAGLTSAGTFHQSYFKREQAQWAVILRLAQLSGQNATIGIVSEGGEEIGSTAYILEKSFGVSPHFVNLEPGKETKADFYLRQPESTNSQILSYLSKFRVEHVFSAPETAVEPLSFWNWRYNLWHGRLSFQREVHLRNSWTLYRSR